MNNKIKKFPLKEEYENTEGIKIVDGKAIAIRDGHFHISMSSPAISFSKTVFIKKGEEILNINLLEDNKRM